MTFKRYIQDTEVTNGNAAKMVDGRFYYVYRITNIVENKHYYGSRVSKIEPKEDLGIKYFSSIKNSENNWIKLDQKLNKSNYKYKILKVFSTAFESIVYESYLHARFDVKNNDKFYNKSNQTPTGFTTVNLNSERHPLYGKERTDEVKNKIRESLKGRFQGSNSPNFGKKREELSNMFAGNGNPFYGKIHSKETKELFSSVRKGSNNSNAKLIYIYDASLKLVHMSNGSFKNDCEKFEFPLNAFNESLRTSEVVYYNKDIKRIKEKNLKFIGWKCSYKSIDLT